MRACLLVALSLLTACDTTAAPTDGGPPVGDAGPLADSGPASDGGPTDASMRDAYVPPCEDCAATLPSLTVENHAGMAHRGMVRATVPFAEGVVTDIEALRGYAANGVPAELVPMSWHYDSSTGDRSSVALAQLRVPMTLDAGERVTFAAERGETSVAPWAAGVPSANWLAGTPEEDAYVEVVVAGDPTPWRAPLFSASPTHIESTDTSVTERHRTHLSRDGEQHPLSLTTYLTRDAGLDHGEIVVVLGNDTLRHAIGGARITRFDLVARAPFRFALRDPAAFGVSVPAGGAEQRWALLGETEIADGVEVAFRGAWAVADSLDSETGRSWQAHGEAPLLGVASFEAWADSRAAGTTGHLVAPRFSTLDEGRAAVAAQCSDALSGSSVFTHLGYLNQNPPSTGDQPDFTSNVQQWFLQVVQTGSTCPLRAARVAVDRETLRPSFYWMQREGVEDRIRAADFPELFFWGGRVHFDRSWNDQYPAWFSRIDGFTPGDTHGWGAMDDQHYGNNALRGVWQLTGDPYLREVLVAHQSLIYWMVLTDYIENPIAERSMRLMKESIALYRVHDRSHTAAELRRRTIVRNTHVLSAVQTSQTAYGNPCYGLVRNDPRVELTTTHPDEDVCMAWQTGFHMEYQALALRDGWDPSTAAAVADLYLDAARDFFLADGTPITYFLMRDTSQNGTGGIGVTWWAGWMHAALARPDHPEASFMLGPVRDTVRSATEAPAGRLWHRGDAWRSFE